MPPTLWSGGRAHSLAGEGLGEAQFRRGDIHCGTLSLNISTLCLLGTIIDDDSGLRSGGLWAKIIQDEHLKGSG